MAVEIAGRQRYRMPLEQRFVATRALRLIPQPCPSGRGRCRRSAGRPPGWSQGRPWQWSWSIPCSGGLDRLYGAGRRRKQAQLAGPRALHRGAPASTSAGPRPPEATPSMRFKDYYEVMGVPRGATQDEIKRAYRKLARKFHPDVSKEKDAEERFKELQEANEVLKDPEKRAAYDQLGSDWRQGQEFRPPPDWGKGFEFTPGRGGRGGRAAGAGRPARTSATSSPSCSERAARSAAHTVSSPPAAAAQGVASRRLARTTSRASRSTSRTRTAAARARSNCARPRSPPTATSRRGRAPCACRSRRVSSRASRSGLRGRAARAWAVVRPATCTSR